MTPFNKHIWIVNTLLEAGARGLSLKEINEKWMRTDQSYGNPISRQTFDRWKNDILDSFGVIIDCRLRDGYRYYISNIDALDDGSLSRWLLDSYSTSNALAQNAALRDRIIVDSVPSATIHLTRIMDAMRENKLITIVHKNFQKKQSYTFPVAPYCLRMFQKRWYMLALSVNDNMLRLYGLDRIVDVSVMSDTFTMPEDFNAKAYFSSFFGVDTKYNHPAQRIVLRADAYHRHYLRSLPLHCSQKEIFTSEEYSDFELYLSPGYEFQMEILRAGARMQVVEPQWLRYEMHKMVKALWDIYQNDMSKNDAEYYSGIGTDIVPVGIFERFPELRPAVGNSYYREDGKHKKLMVVGESNYFPPSLESESVFQDAEKWYRGKDVALIPESMLNPVSKVSNWKEGSPTFDKVYKVIGEVLAKRNIDCKEAVGHEIAFYNYFLRPAFNPGKGSYKEIKPQELDYEVAGWAFKEIVLRLEPDVVVFVSAKSYDAFMKYVGDDGFAPCSFYKVSHPSSIWWNRNGGVYGREKFREILLNHFVSR